VRVLSIDGGGIRGLIPALVLADLERRTGRRVFELFDLIAGTSTGGILACALCAPDPLPASRLVALYEEEGPKIFDRSVFHRIRSGEGLLDEKYDSTALDRALETFLSDKRLSEARPDLIVPAYDMSEPGPYFFKTRKARDEGEDFRLSDVARATSAAPTYFEAYPLGERTLVDGGVFAVNPAMSALAEVMRFENPERVLLLSLGTGQHTRKRSFADIDDWGLVAWARPILDVVFDGQSDAVDYQATHLLDLGHYWRLQVELEQASDDLDDASEGNLRLLRELAEELVQLNSETLDEIAGLL
jgi:patatin-like phospholipase/acyl hydrolase